MMAHRLESAAIMVTIAFHSNQLGLRGTEVALYDYAHFNETILGNRSIIVAPAKGRHDPGSIKRFQSRFSVEFYDSWENLEETLSEEGTHLLYMIKRGEDDGLLSSKIPTAVHAVFRVKEPHGDIYAYVSEWLSKDMSDRAIPFVPHIVNLPASDGDMRKQLGITKDNIVIGCMGGVYSFDIRFVVDEVARLATLPNTNFRFVFLNTRLRIKNPLTYLRVKRAIDRKTIVYLNGTSCLRQKTRFIETCDVMLHARRQGETFGIAIGEFSLLGKPVLTYKGPDIEDRAHLDMLGENGNYYQNPTDLNALLTQTPSDLLVCDAYRDRFNPEEVMRRFSEVFIRHSV